jgi:hypothetical protein
MPLLVHIPPAPPTALLTPSATRAVKWQKKPAYSTINSVYIRYTITHLICLRGCVDQRTLHSSYTPRRTLLDSNTCSAVTVSHSEFLIPHII